MKIVSVVYVCNYKLRITFSDRKTKVIDLEDKIKNAKGIFAPLKDIEYFKQVALDDCQLSICWPNGADICPDVLYNMGKDTRAVKQRKKILRPRKKIFQSRSRSRKHTVWLDKVQSESIIF